jgi:predicted HTH domain antitoxin
MPSVPSNAQNVSVRVEIPWQVASATPPDITRLSRELRVLWIVDQVRQNRVTIGKGAELAELPRAAFMQLLGEHGVPVIDYPIEDLEQEIRSLGDR